MIKLDIGFKIVKFKKPKISLTNMKNITRRSFMKGAGGIAALCTVPSIAFTGETKEDKLRKEVSGLMEEADMCVRYQQDNPTPSIQLIDPKQIIKADIPIKKLYETKRRLIEHVNEYDPLNEESGVLYVYENLDIA